MRMAPGPVRPTTLEAPPSPRVLWVGVAGEAWLALSRAARALGCEPVQASAPGAVSLELSRARPRLVLVHWRQVSERGPGGLGGLKSRVGASGAPVVLVAEPETPAEVLEAADAEGVEDCLLAPVGEAAVRARLATLLGARPPPVTSERYSPRVVLLAGGAGGARTWAGLGSLLEVSGHHLLYSATVEGAAARVEEHGSAPHLLIAVGDGARGGVWARSGTAARALLEGVPSLTVTPAESGRAATLLPRIHAMLGREGASLRVEERVPFCCPVEFGEGGPQGLAWTSGVSFALSPGGLFVRTLVPARPGAAVTLRIHLPTTGERLESHGVVAWANPFAPRDGLCCPHGMGVRFMGMGPPRLMHLRQLCQATASP
ncbi:MULTISPECIES: PilZ domain-containing protein [Myxococcus]|uniref:PilZ domain-containing protein n=1 Tax=Myxococcus llanfairpwllgwyngyllgogerychwyrndrobwllllantysiliogogogochensis TaxID=2590453 RepID=A0A540WI44_9BACT|nr:MULTISPECIES: PilZ domain-containing protein [Myxococcus]NTX02713.1 PilZ domain-containing protein [Myxococcus sp. CA040A]NTX34774.1 PilZ domain-containing protein [Myxococcus sp. CA033]TQF08678.1 PilZ domain-containing protein [Myxococcus llanfairpwllgwyngyllgogerychwyrndrobwllllantysiliogogogochensis]